MPIQTNPNSIEPLVSIIMAVKDTATYLPDCLDSVIAQSYSNWELIAVDDHSADESKSILDKYVAIDKRIVVYEGKNHKLIPILKEAYRKCNGELINRMDSDDKMPFDKIETLVNAWLKYGKGNIIAGGTKHFVDEGEVGGGFIRYENWLNEVARTESHYREIYKECVIPSHCWIVHREDFDKVDGFEPEVYPEDYDLCFRFYLEGLNIVGLDKILHYWRDRSDRISRTWECYKDNRYFELKLKYFFRIDRDRSRPLIIWGTGTNGKDLARIVIREHEPFIWICENKKKIGKHIYDQLINTPSNIGMIDNPQIIIVVSAEKDQSEIKLHLNEINKKPVEDYWFFM